MPHLRRRKGRAGDLRVRTEDASERPVRDDSGGDEAPRAKRRRPGRLRGRGLPRLSLEPPRSDVPARPGSLAALGPLRLSAATAATVLALSSTGNVVALAVVLAVAVARPAAVGAVLFAGLALLERWGTTSLEAVAGAQAVLGPGGLVGPPTAAASAWCAAAALVLASPWVEGDESSDGERRRRLAPAGLVVGLATGAAAAAAVAGPDLAEDLALRLGATLAAVIMAAVVASSRWHVVTTGVALAAGVAATGLAAVVATGRVGL